MPPTIDHSILSPCGHVSERARKAALERTASELFPPGFWDTPKPEPTNAEKAEAHLRHAAMLRDLAARGMSPRKHIRAAEKAESEARRLAEAKCDREP